MDLSLVEWRLLYGDIRRARQRINDLGHTLLTLSSLHKGPVEQELLLPLIEICDQALEILPEASSYYPQSEWMGGDSDDPKNHKLREPNAVPAPRRYFTDAELKEAGAECLGPVQWRYRANPQSDRDE